jgi:hypothetical protein
LLKAVDYLRCSPLALIQRDIVSDPVPPLNVQAFLAETQYGSAVREYHATSEVVEKGKWLCFIGQLDFQPQPPFTWRFKVENHGGEACDFGRRPDADYRGLHYMVVEVSNARGILRRTRFGVYVE